MKLLVLGATGGIGLETIRQALDRDHAVTAFVRSPDVSSYFTIELSCSAVTY